MLACVADTYTCECCSKTYEKAWSDEEAWAEARQLHSPAELEATGVVCDDCFHKIMADTPRIRAGIDQEAAAAGMSYDEYVRRESRIA
jgi:hypothetical protein